MSKELSKEKELIENSDQLFNVAAKTAVFHMLELNQGIVVEIDTELLILYKSKKDDVEFVGMLSVKRDGKTTLKDGDILKNLPPLILGEEAEIDDSSSNILRKEKSKLN